MAFTIQAQVARNGGFIADVLDNVGFDFAFGSGDTLAEAVEDARRIAVQYATRHPLEFYNDPTAAIMAAEVTLTGAR